MIVFDLQCANGHLFEGWFKDRHAFEEQMERSLVTCPVCRETAVSKIPSAFAIKSSAPAPVDAADTAAAEDTATAETSVAEDATDDIEVVGQAGTGVEAIEAARAHRPDVILMDIRMPQMDGLEATRRILGDADWPAKVIILTTFDPDEYVYQALRAGASAFVLKDIPRAELVAAVRTVADWFPQRERSLATGIFNSGSNVGLVLAAASLPFALLIGLLLQVASAGGVIAYIATGGVMVLLLFYQLVLFGTQYCSFREIFGFAESAPPATALHSDEDEGDDDGQLVA